ncbi:hypothetical protein [Dyadobacter fermentans]|uniref:Uncharacterized protein n=1 Tax=Dyadobacter fermentans (strain ATCC 700827 / DSM 18053 / CIP 107007 / KCTC 52180 / NS114) TaxID=471854 RepID=C6W0B4_DYAFD|nr:hypothetical protein [Dyadobacter fermentans]ACT91848.1 hypothetical protein Dfer_0584 [Dyadobacter fermentans DSM 18053]
MKRFALFVLLAILPANASGQHSENDVLVVKEIRDGVVCESCLVTMAGSIGSHTGQISFLTPNHHNQFLYKDSTLTQSFTTEKLSRFFVAMGQFSLDFYPYTSVYKPRQGRSEIYWDFKKLEFRTAVNGQVKNDWTDMGTLKADPEFYIGHATLEAVNDHSKAIQTTPAENYHAGKFDLRLNDSLTVEIRDKTTMQEVYRFSIIRVRSVPDYFNFVEFPADQSFEEILNTQINKVRTEQGPQASHFEIEGGHSAFLRFANDDQYYFFGRIPRNSGIEYALDKPENWKPLGGRKDLKFTNGNTYIYLDKPEPGSKVKIFLRYRHQPESIHEVTVDVKHLPRHPRLGGRGVDHPWRDRTGVSGNFPSKTAPPNAAGAAQSQKERGRKPIAAAKRPAEPAFPVQLAECRAIADPAKRPGGGQSVHYRSGHFYADDHG